MDKEFCDLLTYCKYKDRVCPKPLSWYRLWELILIGRRVGSGWQPSGPLIDSAWMHTTNAEKQNRFHDHILWACKHGLYEKVDRFIRSLSETQWHHFNE